MRQHKEYFMFNILVSGAQDPARPDRARLNKFHLPVHNNESIKQNNAEIHKKVTHKVNSIK